MGWDRNCRALLKSARVKVSTEMFRDPKLLVEVHEWEKNASKNDPPDQLGKGVLSHARSQRLCLKSTLDTDFSVQPLWPLCLRGEFLLSNSHH